MKGYKDALYELVGKTIDIRVPQLTTTGTNLRTESFLVIAAYPNYIMTERICENGYTYRECFNVGTLVAEGILQRRGYDYDGL